MKLKFIHEAEEGGWAEVPSIGGARLKEVTNCSRTFMKQLKAVDLYWNKNNETSDYLSGR